MRYKHYDFNAQAASKQSQEDFLKEHSGNGLDEKDLKEAHRQCKDEAGISDKPTSEDVVTKKSKPKG